MQLHPTRTAVDLGLLSSALVVLGAATARPAVLAWGGSMLIGLALARGVTMLGVTQVRSAGFEMLWQSPERRVSVGRGGSVALTAEVRNRDVRAARYLHLRAIASPHLEVSIDPVAGEVPAGGSLEVTVTVHAPRVGWHAIHALALEVRGGPGLFEVPLTFPNPFGIEVLPQAYMAARRSLRGGRERQAASAPRSVALSGDSLDLRELREHRPGDPFKRIAWKASARRGRLLVREYEREDHDVVWLLLDASVEHWAGPPGAAPLDRAIDEVSALATSTLRQGDAVGLGILARRRLAWLPPAAGASHGARLAHLLATSTAAHDADRSELDEEQVEARVLEHLRSLDPSAARLLRTGAPEQLAEALATLLPRAPFGDTTVQAPTEHERLLRSYLLRFGVHDLPQQSPEEPYTAETLRQSLEALATARPRPSIVVLWSPGPSPALRPELGRALRALARRHVEVRWVPMKLEEFFAPSTTARSVAARAALTLRIRTARAIAERQLTRLGVRVETLRPRPHAQHPDLASDEPTTQRTS